MFTTLSEEQWLGIRSIRNWPDGTDWRGEIELIGRCYWEDKARREKWIQSLQGKRPSKQREKIEKALMLMRQSREALSALKDQGLLDENIFPNPDFEPSERQLEAWLEDYDLYVQPFAGKSNPIQAQLESRLIDLWKKSGGKVSWSRKKDDPGTPYAPLVDFLTLALDAVLGRAFRPSGIAKLIDRCGRDEDNMSII